ncbi:DUF5791 family protein [Halobacteriaceae archaeon GCM10025711]
MLYEEIADPEAVTPERLRVQYERELADVVDAVGVEAAASEADVDRSRLDSLLAGESVSFTVAEAARLLALAPDYPDGDVIMHELRDHVMLQMSSAVLDVDALESGLNGDLNAREIQQKIEGRREMTLAEYARIHHYIASNVDW